MIQPWIVRELHHQKAADFERTASSRRLGPRDRRPCPPGYVAVLAGRSLVALGWRLGGAAALPETVRRQLV
jgi:hypothetical protein